MKKLFRLCLTVLMIGLLTVPAFAFATDEVGVLTQEELEYLDGYTEKIRQEYGIGVYIMLVDGYERYSTSGYREIFDVTADVYHSNGLGAGEGRDGVLLMVDLSWREMAFFVYGDNAEYALDPYGQLLLEEAFLDDFREDQWFDGLSDFLETCEDSFERARAGEPIRESNAPMHGMVWLIAGIAAFVTCLICSSGMKTARKQLTASAYADISGLTLTKRDDFFTHRTVTRVRKPESSGGSGGRAHTGHGGSGRSARF